MTTLREAAQQALEALNHVNVQDRVEIINNLRAALAEPVQEPVAWMVYTEGGTSAYVTDNPNDLVGAYRALALYTAPPQRKPLTDDQLDDIAVAARRGNLYDLRIAIERAHGIV